MTDQGYGQQAPRLSDGSLLLAEIILTPEQTRDLKYDIDLSRQALQKSKMLFVSLLSSATVALLAAVVIVVLALTGTIDTIKTLVFAALIFALSELSKSIHKGRMRSAAGELRGFKSLPLVTSTVNNYWAAHDTGERMSNYIDLLCLDSVSLDSASLYHLVLDRSTENRYVLRIVQHAASPEADQ